jgi:hypothetical protein
LIQPLDLLGGLFGMLGEAMQTLNDLFAETLKDVYERDPQGPAQDGEES